MCGTSDGGSAGAVGVDRLDVAAHRDVQEAVDLALRVVKAARARPAVGAAEHRARAVIVPHTRRSSAPSRSSAASHDIGTNSSRPRRSSGPRSAFEPAAAHHRLRDARAMAQGAGEILDDAVRIGSRIIRMRPNFEFVALPARRKHAPMGGMRPERRFGCRSGRGLVGYIGHREPLIVIWCRRNLPPVLLTLSGRREHCEISEGVCLARASGMRPVKLVRSSIPMRSIESAPAECFDRIRASRKSQEYVLRDPRLGLLRADMGYDLGMPHAHLCWPSAFSDLERIYHNNAFARCSG